MSTQEQILELFKRQGAYWVHDGNFERPHAMLTKGNCSNGFINCRLVLREPRYCRGLAKDLVEKLEKTGINRANVDWVVGSSYSAITFSYEVAALLNAIHAFTEKHPENPKKQIWKEKAPEGTRILQIEKLITTSGTFKDVNRAIREDNPHPVEIISTVGTVVHRPSKLFPVDYGVQVVSLLEKEIWSVDPSDCPLCEQGSEPIRPRHGNNWDRLTNSEY